MGKQKFALKENKPHLYGPDEFGTVPKFPQFRQFTRRSCNINFLFFPNTNDSLSGFLRPTIPAYESLVSTAIHPSFRRTLATY